MTARESSLVHPNHKTKYRVWNWREYEAELCKRGDLTVWISPGAIQAWTPEPTGRRAAQPRYSDLAIETSLTLGKLFHLSLRQTEGFVRSVLQLLGVALKAPDHSTLSRRNKTVEIPQLCPVQLIVNSTGLKMCGSGEWRREKWGKTRRDWRKLHMGVDKKGLIVVSVLTESGAEDAATVERLLGPLEVPIQRFTGDGAYDKVSVYEQLDKTGTDDVEVVIPPRKDGVESDPTGRSRDQRNAAIKRIQEIRSASLGEGVRLSRARPRGEHIPSAQTYFRRSPSLAVSRIPGTRDPNRHQNPQPYVRSRASGFGGHRCLT